MRGIRLKHIMLIQIASVLVAILMVGCSSVPTQQTKKAPQSRSYASELKSVSVEKLAYDYCPQSGKIQGESKWKKLVEYANGCVTKQQWINLEMIGDRLNQVDPDSPWGSYFLSVASENKGFKERALWMIDLALKKAPDMGILRYQKGRILWALEFYKESVVEIKKSVSLDKSIKDAYVFLGQIYLRELNFSESVKSFESALMMDSRDKDSLVGITSCYVELEKASDALAYTTKGISLYPRVLEFRLHEAFIYENMIRQNEVALIKYKEIKSLLAQRKLDGIVPFDLDTKIKNLETTVQKSPAKLATSSR